MTPAIHECLVDLAEATRHDARIALGVSTRSLVMAIPALQVWAMLHGRDFVSPRDVKSLAVPMLSHRLELAAGVTDADAVLADCAAPIIECHTRKTLAR